MATAPKKKPAAPKKAKRKSPAKKATKKYKRKKKGMLSEMVSHSGLKKSAKSAGGGFLGGAGFSIIEMLVDSAMEDGGMKEIVLFGTAAGAAVIAGGGLDAPSVSAGVGGAYGYRMTKKIGDQLLSEMENEEYADEDSLEEYPDALDENGTPMYLADDGNFYYLEEFELAEGQQFDLAESFQADDMYPQYVNSSRY